MKKHLSRIGAALALGSSLLAFADIAQPIAPVAVYVMVGSAAGLFLLLVIRFIFKYKREAISVLSYFFTITLTLAIGLFSYQQVIPDAKSKGILASQFKGIEGIQSSLGMLSKDIATIKKDVKEVSNKVDSVKQDTSKITKNIEEVKREAESISSKMDKVKKETSDNPRKELANMGVMWTAEQFGMAASNGDLKVVELFLKGGMKPDVIWPSKKRRVISQLLTRHSEHSIKVFNLFEKYGANFGKKRRIMLYGQRGAFRPVYSNSNLLEAAAEWQNLAMTRYLVKKGVDTSGALKQAKHSMDRWHSINERYKSTSSYKNPNANPYRKIVGVLQNQ